MDKCQFSEFSYGYCVTEDLIVGQGMQLTAAPIFPSLIEEGQQGGGYDARLNRPGAPLFLQFKLVHQMVRGNAYEATRGHFQVPFYRMHLRPLRISDQHNSLLTLEQSGNEVYYVAPAFHTASTLDAVYASKQVWNRSFRIRPRMIGPLPSNGPHHVTFTAGGAWRRYSEEASEEMRVPQTEEIEHALQLRIEQRGRRPFREQAAELDASLLQIVRERNNTRRAAERINLSEIEADEDRIRRAAYISRQFFDCQLFFVTQK